MKKEIKYLLNQLIDNLIKQSSDNKLKWGFNFSYTEKLNLAESYLSQIAINTNSIAVKITRTYQSEGELSNYNLIADNLDFSGYIEGDSEIKSKLKYLVELIERNNLINSYPLLIQRLIDFNLKDKKESSVESNNKEKPEEKEQKKNNQKDQEIQSFIQFLEKALKEHPFMYCI